MKWQDILKRTYTPEEQERIDAAIAEREAEESKLPIPTGELPDWAKRLSSEEIEPEEEKSKEDQIREMASLGRPQEGLPTYLQEAANEPSEEVAPPNPENERVADEFNTNLDTHTEGLRGFEEFMQSGNTDPEQRRLLLEELEESSDTLAESIRQMFNIAEEAPVVSEEQTRETSETLAGRTTLPDMSLVYGTRTPTYDNPYHN